MPARRRCSSHRKPLWLYPLCPCLSLLLSANLEVRRRLQELQTKNAAEMEAGRAVSPAHRVSVYGHGPHRL